MKITCDDCGKVVYVKPADECNDRNCRIGHLLSVAILAPDDGLYCAHCPDCYAGEPSTTATLAQNFGKPMLSLRAMCAAIQVSSYRTYIVVE